MDILYAHCIYSSSTPVGDTPFHNCGSYIRRHKYFTHGGGTCIEKSQDQIRI